MAIHNSQFHRAYPTRTINQCPNPKSKIQNPKSGGNAFDATVAIAATLNVAEPMMSGLGGFGTPGGHTIGQTVPQMVMNLIDFEMDIQQAIAAPRISFEEPETLLVEETISSGVRDALAALGHRVRLPDHSLGDAHGLTVEYDASGHPLHFTGGSDPRGDGLAKGY